MARNKHSVALFEVIQSSKAQRSGMSLNTPQWWFKRRTPSSENAAGSISSAPNIPALSAPVSAPAVFEPQNLDTAPAPRAPGVDLQLDSERQRITFNVTYTSAIVTAFSVLVVVALAYAIGQHLKQGPSTALAGPPIEQIRQGAVNAGAMNVGASWGTPAPTNPQHAPQATAPAVEAAAAAGAPVPIAKNTNTNVAPTLSPSGQRQIGLNYIVVQGYPLEERAMAIEACDQLNKNNIPCTIETNLDGYKMFTVVTLTGFEKISSPEYDNYVKAIRAIGEKFTKSPKFKKFEPTAKKWKGN